MAGAARQPRPALRATFNPDPSPARGECRTATAGATRHSTPAPAPHAGRGTATATAQASMDRCRQGTKSCASPSRRKPRRSRNSPAPRAASLRAELADPARRSCGPSQRNSRAGPSRAGWVSFSAPPAHGTGVEAARHFPTLASPETQPCAGRTPAVQGRTPDDHRRAPRVRPYCRVRRGAPLRSAVPLRRAPGISERVIRSASYSNSAKTKPTRGGAAWGALSRCRA